MSSERSWLHRAATIAAVNSLLLLLMLAGVDHLVVPKLIDGSPQQKSKPYHTNIFFEEQSVASQTRKTFRNGYFITENVTRRGTYFNVIDGLRVTVPNSRSARGRVLIFGGSTTFCGNVPDDLTWPSQLANIVAGQGFEVVNYGVSGASVGDRLRRLKSLGQLRRSDIVIFYFGVNDAMLHRQANGPTGLLARQPRLRRLLELAARFSKTAEFVLHTNQEVFIEPTVTTDVAVGRTTHDLDSVNEIVSAHGGRFLALLQPNAFLENWPTRWTRQPDGDYETAIVAAVRTYYSAVESHLRTRPYFVDATGFFSELERSPYEDWNHVDENGNRAIAVSTSRILDLGDA
jgi:lysophospholipase L1-like esterase